MQPFIIKNGDMVGRGRQGYRAHHTKFPTMHIYSGHNVQHIPINQTRGISGPGRQLHGISGTQYHLSRPFLMQPIFWSVFFQSIEGGVCRLNLTRT